MLLRGLPLRVPLSEEAHQGKEVGRTDPVREEMLAPSWSLLAQREAEDVTSGLSSKPGKWDETGSAEST